MKKEVIKLEEHNMSRVISRAKKDYGFIERGSEDFYNPQLDYLEHWIYEIYEEIPINDRELKEVIEMIIYDIKSIVEDKSYDYKDIRSYEQCRFAYNLEYIFNPFVNSNIKLNEDGKENIKDVFTLPVMCLLRIYDSIEFWNKRYGKNGYYKMLEEYVFPKTCVGRHPYALYDEYLDFDDIEK